VETEFKKDENWKVVVTLFSLQPVTIDGKQLTILEKSEL